MILYSDKDDHYSHRVRIVLAEKDVACEIKETTNEEAPEEVLSINPEHCLPILVDRELGLYNACLLYTSPSPRDLSTSRMPSSA